MTAEILDTAPAEGAPSAARALAARPGAIVLARHGEPALSRKCKLTAAEYDAWWGRYETGGLLEGQTPPPHILEAAARADRIFSSTRPRSIQTATAVAGGREFTVEPLLIEAPLPPPRWPDFIRLSPRHWGVVSRLWWWFLDHHADEESRAEAKTRAQKAAETLAAAAADGRDVLVTAHGFFNTMIGLELRRMGWRCVSDRGFKYWSTRTFEKRG